MEFDSPDALLVNPVSEFTSLVKQTGVAEAERLHLLASAASSKVKSILEKLNDDTSDELQPDNAEYDPLIQ